MHANEAWCLTSSGWCWLLNFDFWLKLRNISRIADIIFGLLQIQPPEATRNTDFLSATFASGSSNVDAIFCRSSIFDAARNHNGFPAATQLEKQLSAKLHCHYGVPVISMPQSPAKTHSWARSKVYDLRNYDEGTEWGPFLPDGSGRVDWEKMEAILILLGYNISILADDVDVSLSAIWRVKWRGAVPYSGLHHTKPTINEGLDLSLDMRDPYGVSGTWLRVRISIVTLKSYQPFPLTEKAKFHCIPRLKI